MKHGLSLTRQAVSQHLDALESAGLVHTKREGRYKYHYLDLAPLDASVQRWLQWGSKGPVTTAVFDDTSGNLIQIAQKQGL